MVYANGMDRLQVVHSPEPDAPSADMPKRIGILIFEDFSLVEVSSISEVFSLANQIRVDAAGAERGATHTSGDEAPNYAL